jgi:hypothetical protein
MLVNHAQNDAFSAFSEANPDHLYRYTSGTFNPAAWSEEEIGAVEAFAAALRLRQQARCVAPLIARPAFLA